MNFNIEKVKPKNKEELKQLIKESIYRYGTNCDLNFIDTSLITNMAYLFYNLSSFNSDIQFFNGDISEWDVSNVTNMSFMFHKSQFNGDISELDVSNVKDMKGMFSGSNFNGNINQWHINKDCIIEDAFVYNSRMNSRPIWYGKQYRFGLNTY